MTNAPDTASRSLAHWSDADRSEMDAFYALARLDYELLADAIDWRALIGARQDATTRPVDSGQVNFDLSKVDQVSLDHAVTGSRPLTLLDVACGSGKFPETLLDRAGLDGLDELTYDLLDPSAFSLREAASVLRPPFQEGRQLECTLEELDAAEGPWDLVWATHALYALEPAHLRAAVQRLRAAIAPGGVAFLAHGSADGHYLKVYEAFLEGVRDGAGTPYVSSEDLIAELRAQGAEPQVRRIAYDHVVAADDTAVVEGYLQRCVFDDTLGLADLMTAPVLGPYLASRFDAREGVYRFHHEVDCIVLAPHGGTVPWTVAS